ncbi:hypothetical protein CEXT_240191 [Caerostris extrusa]|uniref:Uncharacterized protein n=1 Tax=Caerostris extrusa TaxID=172846 RepID=A0AAV4PWE6_CAEEX|nr:hypothetical protein CEXT_240191 [Caerostris extrusa]
MTRQMLTGNTIFPVMKPIKVYSASDKLVAHQSKQTLTIVFPTPTKPYNLNPTAHRARKETAPPWRTRWTVSSPFRFHTPRKGSAPDASLLPSRKSANASLVSQIEAWKQSMRRHHGYRWGHKEGGESHRDC